MRRRDFITGIAGSAAGWPLAARAQQRPKILRVGTVSTLPRERRPTWRAFEQRMLELGYVEGANLLLDYTIERNVHLYAPPTQEMVRRKVDIVVVRRQSFWDSERDKLREALARLVGDVRRLACDAASGVGR